jgi:L-ascorbate metabolism protein UlaG (beta-lactamase superfamily)
VEYRGLTVYFAGDTAFAPEHFRATAERFPRIDLALLPIGPIAPRLTTRRNHMDPSDALEAARLLGAAAMLPIHHDTFVHSFDEPGDCVAALRDALDMGSPFPSERVHILQVGEQRAFPAAASPVELARSKARAPRARLETRASP